MTCTFIRQTPFSHQPLFKVSLKGDSLTQVLLYIFSLKCRCCRNIIKQLLKEKLKLPPTTMNVSLYDKNVCHIWITPSWISKNNYQNRTEQNFNYRVKFSGHEWWHERTYKSVLHMFCGVKTCFDMSDWQFFMYVLAVYQSDVFLFTCNME